ncbi:MAG: hypothetical protein KKD11_02075 [Candidatus Omnitrophica bacterium]|nr:hypothetical protein [Candidatus Omnitrophota bacterium]
MKKFIVLSVVVFVFFVVSGTAFAGCGACGPVSAESSGTDEAIDGLCPSCTEVIKSNPERYMPDIKKECMIKCPECGVEIDVMEECKKAGTCCS